MKIIELLNKIAKGELEDLTLVNFCKNNCLAKYHKTDNRFEFMNKGEWDDYFHLIDIEELNDEVEVIEEEKEIEKGIKPYKQYVEELGKDGYGISEINEEYLDRLSKIVIELINDMRDKE